MSKSRTGWLLAIFLCIPLASCVMDEEGLDDPEVTEEAVPEQAAEPEAIEASADCSFSQQCDPCEPPWVQQTA